MSRRFQFTGQGKQHQAQLAGQPAGLSQQAVYGMRRSLVLGGRRSVQAARRPRKVNPSPTAAATTPPSNIQTALSVGDPVKNLDTSELNEFMALMPKMMSTTPAMMSAMETMLFITVFACELDEGQLGRAEVSSRPSSHPAALKQIDDHHENGEHQQDVEEASQGGAGHQTKQP
jgi:hypothetical protein